MVECFATLVATVWFLTDVSSFVQNKFLDCRNEALHWYQLYGFQPLRVCLCLTKFPELWMACYSGISCIVSRHCLYVSASHTGCNRMVSSHQRVIVSA